MYNVLLVDDEPLILEGLGELIKWEEYGLEIVGKALNGLEALTILEKTKIHILVTDVKMPKMNGLELIQHVKEHSPETKCIVLSGYNDFEYVRSAAVLGIENYLLKPVNEKELIPTLENAVSRLDNELYKKMESQEGIRLLRDNILLRWVSGDIDAKDLRERAAMLGLDIGSEQFLIVVVKILNEDSHFDSRMDSHVNSSDVDKLRSHVQFAVNNMCNLLVSESGIGSSFYDLNGHIVILFQGNPSQLIQENIQKTLTEFVRNTTTLLKTNVFVSVGTHENDYQNLYKSYNQARKNQDYRLVLPENAILFHEDARMQSQKREKEFMLDFKRLNAALTKKDKTSSLQCIEEILKVNKAHFLKTPSGLHDVGTALLMDIVGTFKLLNMSVSGTLDSQRNLTSRIRRIGNYEELMTWIVEILSLCFDSLDVEEHRKSSVVKKVLEYVTANYADDINLKTVAAKFYMNPFYLGQLFNKEAGMNFNNLLNEVRIEKAKELLLKGTLKANEIAVKVGYSNPNYFLTVFKKITGMSPSEYKLE